jgi:hypothetical protein
MEIYKYLSIDDDILDSLLSGHFRFTQFKVLNDKYEGNWANKSDVWNIDDLKSAISKWSAKFIDVNEVASEDIIKLNSSIPADRTDPYKTPGIYTFSNEEKKKHHEEYMKGINNLLNDEMEKYCVFSTSGYLNSQLLWSHYANCENGVIISFDASHEYFKDLSKIRYTNMRPDINKLIKIDYKNLSDMMISPQAKKWMNKCFFLKSSCWSYENEYRLLKMSDKADITKTRRNGEIMYLFSIPFSAWAGIYYGSELVNKYEQKLQLEFSRKPDKRHIKRYKVMRDKKKYKYNICPR